MKSTILFWGSAILALSGIASGVPLRLTTGLTGINVYESTGTISTYTFTTGPSGAVSPNTFTTVADEFIGAYFSSALGAPDIDGEFLSINCYYAGPGNGCNFAGIELVTTGGNQLANVLASFRSGSDGGYVAGSELNAVDNSLTTFSTLGRDGESNMRLTVGFNGPSNSNVPEPSTYALLCLALTAGTIAHRRRK